ncbi:MAG: LacI family DNA-binding transcriptional regulator [Chloroflexota bacterium]
MAIGSVRAKDVAREAAVSVGTVSRVFNNHANVEAGIRLRVLRAAAELGYVGPHPTRMTGALSEVGFLFSPVNDGTAIAGNPYWSRILAGVEAEARKSRIKLVYSSVDALRHRPAELMEAVRAMKLDGALLVGPAAPEVIDALQRLTCPIVQVDDHAPGHGIDAVVTDSFEGGFQAGAYLIREGHREIACINGPLGDGPRPRCKLYMVELRAHGYRAALLDAGLPVDHTLMESSDLTANGGYEACRRLLARQASFSAIFCTNDAAAIGAIRALREAGREVPRDISVIGYGDDTYVAEHLTPALTTIVSDTELLGATAVKRLLARAADPTMAPTMTMLGVELVKRESVRPRSA